MKWNRSADSIAWVSPRATRANIHMNPKYWREHQGYNLWVKWLAGDPDFPLTDENRRIYQMYVDMAEEDIDGLPEVISHETIHLILQKIAPWDDSQEVSASHGWDNRTIFGWIDRKSGAGCDIANLEEYITRHTPIPLPAI